MHSSTSKNKGLQNPKYIGIQPSESCNIVSCKFGRSQLREPLVSESKNLESDPFRNTAFEQICKELQERQRHREK